MRHESAPKLTARQKECLDFIRAYTFKHAIPPTIRIIADAMGISSQNGVVCHLLALERKGFITREHRYERAITLTSLAFWSLPFGGSVE